VDRAPGRRNRPARSSGQRRLRRDPRIAGIPAQEPEITIMDTTNREYVCRVRASNLFAHCVFSEDDQVWKIEAYMKRPGGILFLEKRYGGDLPTEHILVSDVVNFGWFSPRPAQLGKPFDPSMSYPVLGLFLHFCAERKYDTEQLLRSAFPHVSDDLWDAALEIAAQSGWEETAFPEGWTDPALVGRLLVALDQVGYRTLADALENLLIDGA
jgi:hypothetical protein